MGYRIAITGKGGVGKTTVAALVISSLLNRGCSPVLAVDADPNSCLDEALGVTVQKTIGGAREEARIIAKDGMASGIAKKDLLELKIAESLVEAKDFDLIAMGRPEGPGCYCYSNSVLKEVLAHLTSEYPFIVLDNEAGLENLSRRLAQKVELLVMVADPSRKGMETILRLHALAREMEIDFDRLAVIINRSRNGDREGKPADIKTKTNADFLLHLPYDPELLEYSEQGKSILSLSRENSLVKKMDEFLDVLELKSRR
jgi:CO dehydrogenase maturation factor